MTIPEFVSKHSFGATVCKADKNPAMESDTPMDHYKVTLIAPKPCSKLFDRMTIVFSMGKGLKGKLPTAADVLNAIALDSSALDMQLEEFQAEFGYEDVRKARKVWNNCRKEAAKFQNAFGKTKLDELRAPASRCNV